MAAPSRPIPSRDGAAHTLSTRHIRTRLYPAALSKAFPDNALRFEHLHGVATGLKASPVLEDR